MEKTAGARGRATGVAFLCIGARDRGIWATLTVFGVSRDAQETPEMLSMGPDRFPEALRGSEKLG